ncbi:hypothetical protein TNCV_335651 [Trichonephila clavipes]|nr:hypothetical protein TNCV_335651 [Trichonephila clavipes]
MAIPPELHPSCKHTPRNETTSLDLEDFAVWILPCPAAEVPPCDVIPASCVVICVAYVTCDVSSVYVPPRASILACTPAGFSV